MFERRVSSVAIPSTSVIRKGNRKSAPPRPLWALPAWGCLIIGFFTGVSPLSAAELWPEHTPVGKIKPRTGLDIKASPLGVGFETLDRKMFDPSRTYDALSKLGVKWARVQTGWNRCETVKGQYDFKWLDEVVDSLIKIGVQPWFNVGYGNKLYSPKAPDTATGWVPDYTDEERAGWLAFVRALARHYRGRVNRYEIWNEPTGRNFWMPNGWPSPRAYTAFVRRTSNVVRKEIPGCVVIGGAFYRFPNDYLEKCLKNGLARAVDRVSFHPYAEIPEKDYVRDVSWFRRIVKHARPDMDVWQGENGCPSTTNSVGALSHLAWNEDAQARWLLRRVMNDLSLSLEMISWYHISDQDGYRLTDYPDGKSGATYGLLRRVTYALKPSYFAYQNLCALFDSDTAVSDQTEVSFVEGAGTLDPYHTDNIVQANFNRNKKPICGYWRPLDVLKDTPVATVNVRLTGKLSASLKNPVLIDPMSGSVYTLKGECQADGWRFTGLPVTDYPLLITDMDLVK